MLTISKNPKCAGDLGITYDEDVLRLLDIFQSMGFATAGVVITQFENQPSALAFRHRLDTLGIKSYLHYPIAGYPYDTARIVSEEGYGRNEYIETTHPLVVVTAPGPALAKWQLVSLSSITSTNMVLRLVMQNTRLSLFGICR